MNISRKKVFKEITTIYISVKMDYLNLQTYKTQMKYIKKIYEIRINEIDYKNKISELIKLMRVYESVFDNEDIINIKSDISMLESKIEENKQLIKKYSDLIEHIEILCNCQGMNDTKYLDKKPKNAVKWINVSIQKMEEDYGEYLKQ